MKKQSTIQIIIPKPCHENWEAMTAVEKGRFCDSCQKVVADFTQMDDAEIIRYFQEGKNLCGRFNNDQLNRPLQLSVEKPHYFVSNFYKKIAAGLLFGIGFLNQSFAQQKKQNTTQQPSNISKNKSTNFFYVKGKINADLELLNVSMYGLSVYLRIDTLAIISMTDSNGRFVFKIPNKYRNRSAIIGSNEYNQQAVVLMEGMESIQLKTIQVMKVANGSMGVVISSPFWDKNSPPATMEGVKVPRKNLFWYRISRLFK